MFIRNGEKLEPPFVVRNGTYNGYRDNFPAVPPTDYDGLNPAWRDALSSHLQNGELVVPPDSIFAMGDNRDVSLDSRYWGFVPYENVIGRPMFIYWSFEQPRDEYTRTSIAERLQYMVHDRDSLLRPDPLVSNVPRGALMPRRVSRRSTWVAGRADRDIARHISSALSERQPLSADRSRLPSAMPSDAPLRSRTSSSSSCLARV